MLHPKLTQTIKDTHKSLLNEGRLPSLDNLHGYYATFRERFKPDVLRGYEGEELLIKMHSLNRTDRNSLVYWLEFKNDEEFPAIFGSIAGGSALKFRIYQNAKTGAWMGPSPSKPGTPVETSLEQAIEIARRHRDQLVHGAALLENLPQNADDAAYSELQQKFNQQLPDIADTAWGHKYFSLMFPDKLDDYHVAQYQRFHLVQLLQTDIPREELGRYIAAGRYVRIAQELDMPLNHLTSVLNHLNDKPYPYWCVWASDLRHVGDFRWQSDLEGGFVSISWPELGDLSTLEHTKGDKTKLWQNFDQHYPATANGERQSVFNFITSIDSGSPIVAIDPQSHKIVRLGKTTSRAYFESSDSSHRVSVDWLPHPSWQFTTDEGFDTPLKEIRIYTNQVEIERHILESNTVGPIIDPVQKRIQTILERKGQVILYGPPGTGKTYWAESTACELSSRQIFEKPFSELNGDQRSIIWGSPNSTVQLCSFHPAYGYEDFLEGYRPQLINEQMVFVRQNGIFKQLCEQAKTNPSRNFYLIIDEINRGDIPRIFGELFTVIEKDKRGKTIILPLSGQGFVVPPNVYVIGTMNTADRSIALLDTALRRRFGFIELLPDITQIRSTVLAGIPLGLWLEELNKRILKYVGRDARNLQIGHAFFLEGGKPITDFGRFARIIREDIIPLLEEYCYEDYNALRQILGTTLVDDQNQIIRQELFEIGHESDLVQALLEPTPDLMTIDSVTEAEKAESEEAEEKP